MCVGLATFRYILQISNGLSAFVQLCVQLSICQFDFSCIVTEALWTAPEVLRMEQIDDYQKSDIYSLGIILKEVFTRSGPYTDYPFLTAYGKVLPNFAYIPLSCVFTFFQNAHIAISSSRLSRLYLCSDVPDLRTSISNQLYGELKKIIFLTNPN